MLMLGIKSNAAVSGPVIQSSSTTEVSVSGTPATLVDFTDLSPQTGDIMVLLLHAEGESSASLTISSTGWTKFSFLGSYGSNHGIYKVYAGSPTATAYGAVKAYTGIKLLIRGATTIISSQIYEYETFGASPYVATIPSLNTTGYPAFLGFHAVASSNIDYTINSGPAGYTLIEHAAGTYPKFSVYYKQGIAPTATYAPGDVTYGGTVGARAYVVNFAAK